MEAGWRPAFLTCPYSLDLRERVTALMASGSTCREAASRLGVSVSPGVKWSQRLRSTSSVSALPMGEARRDVLGSQRDWLVARIQEKPDLTLRTIRGELADRGLKVSYDAVEQLGGGIVAGEVGPGPDGPPELGVQGLDRVRRIDDPPDLVGERPHWRRLRPATGPKTHGDRRLFASRHNGNPFYPPCPRKHENPDTPVMVVPTGIRPMH